ncbi:MAG: DUF1223 domain-containing protein [Pseudomonadota bacterium]
MSKFFYAYVIISILCITPTIQAQEIEYKSGKQQVALIELYTSQGCSSCPPADEWLAQLKNKPGLWDEFVPVAFHVDYWDYLGWKDSFSSAEHSNRQRLHRKQGNVSVVYTPGFFLNGKEWRSRFGRKIPGLGDPSGELNAMLNNNMLSVRFEANQVIANTLHVGVLGFGYQTPIQAGENSNRVLHEDFVLLSHTKHKSTNGTWEVTLPEKVSPRAKKYALAIWVSNGNNLRPIQTTGGWLPTNLY